MTDPFTSNEVQKALNKLKNKSTGINNIKAEILKNAPETIIIEIAKILNNIAETGNYPKEIMEGRQLSTYIPMMKKRFIEYNTTWENEFLMEKDRREWSRFLVLHCDP